MAVPKVCGIENEFGFAILRKSGSELNPVDLGAYSELSHAFVRDYLNLQKAARYDRSREARRPPDDDEEETLIEKLHRGIIERSGNSADGFLDNGARFYLDVAHPEYSTPECLKPLDLVAHDKASELVMLAAADLFYRQKDREGYLLYLHKNNSDGLGNSYGCHLNMLLNRAAVEHDRHAYLVRHYMPFQIARMVLIGAGKFGSENKRPSCRFQISQRADFFENLVGYNTTSERPIFNLRDEPHADFGKYYRLHDISTDALLCEEAIFLKVALTQVVLAMIEDKFLSRNMMPWKPVEAMIKVSRDLKFRDRIRMENGKKLTGMEILRYYLSKARDYLSGTPMTDQHLLAVKRAEELLEILEKDPALAFGRLDWATAWKIMESRPAEAKKNLRSFREIYPRNPHLKLSEKVRGAKLLDSDSIKLATSNPPNDTKAYLRSEIIKRFGSGIVHMNWGSAYMRSGDRMIHLDFDEPSLDKLGADMILSELDR